MNKGSERTLFGCIVAFISIAAAAMVLAQGADEGAPAYREKIMRINGASFGAINDILKFKLPGGTDHIAAQAEVLQRESELIAVAFEQQVLTDESRALPTIWQQWDDFVAAADALGQASAKLAEVAKSGDQGAVMAQVKVVGQSCGGCHETFRKPND